MFLDPFHARADAVLRVSAAQGSAFAKDVAGDFNPIHDAGNPRFCVPGDLLFALVLAEHGLASQMELRFTGMVGADAALTLTHHAEGSNVADAQGKTCLEVAASGAVTDDPGRIESLVRRYVAFSGQNFPHILVPLMESHGVMINPDRPLVIYERMAFALDSLDFRSLDIALAGTELEVKGRRGEARLAFTFSADGVPVGQGSKTLLLSGLRDYDRDALQGLVERYAGWKAAYLAAS